MGISKTTEAAYEPVTLDEAQAQVRNWQSGQEDILTSLIKAAREVLEEQANRTFVNSVFTYTRKGFPGASRFDMPRSPLVSVTSVKYYDNDNSPQTLSTAYYSVITNEPRGYIWLNDTYSWPSTYSRPDALEVIFTAGYGATASTVPVCVKQAVLLLVSHWWKNRDIVIQGPSLQVVPKSVDALIGPVRIASEAF